MARNLKRTRNKEGMVIPGLWEGENVRMERDGEYWEFQVPSREIGKTGFYEWRPVALDGKWRTAGWRGTLASCIRAAENMMSGEVVLRPTSGRGDEKIPAHLIPWAEVAEEIAAHPSVRGE